MDAGHEQRAHGPGRRAAWAAAAPLAAWTAAAAATAWLDGRVDLGSQGTPLVLAAAATGLWWPAWAAAAASLAATLAFNWFFVPPRGSWQVGLNQHVLLLAAMLAVGAGVAVLVSRQRQIAEREALQAARVRELMALGERLRTADAPAELLAALRDALGRIGVTVTALRVRLADADAAAAPAGDDGCAVEGTPNDDERAGLRLCMTQATPFGPGTGRYEFQGRWYLPLRGRSATVGAALLVPVDDGPVDEAAREQAQSMCDQVGGAVERTLALRASAEAARRVRDARLRNTILAAVSHDYRTPLAAIMGAASALREQDERLSPEQRRRLAAVIVDEVEQLGRLTDNALQLARLDTPGVALRLDWESAEELVGSVLARVRRRDPARRVRARIEPGLPLVRCDAVLVVQLLENLIDNALKYAPPESPVEVQVRRDAGQLLIAVRDRGPGVPPEWRERIFEVFQRQEPAAATGAGAGPGRPAEPPADARRPRGAGVGLAVCRAVAEAHGGTLALRARAHGGASFECRLPLPENPAEWTCP